MLKVFFSPGCEKPLIEAIKKTQSKLDISIYCFTNKDLANVLVELHEKNLPIRILADSSQFETSMALKYLLARGFYVKLTDRMNHNKFLIRDNTLVATGSYNYTKNAETWNYENLLFIENEDSIIQEYIIYFENLWSRFSLLSKDILRKKKLDSPSHLVRAVISERFNIGGKE
jgi:phosphatidylserine/phosphatidylglycerophosphate/cardiolipin synthase-like enzyme